MAWHVVTEVDEFEDEFLLLMMECYDLSILFRRVVDFEEFIYIVMDLGDEGNRLIDVMRNLIRFFRRQRWEINENVQDAVQGIMYELVFDDLTTVEQVMVAWAGLIDMVEMNRDDRRIIRYLLESGLIDEEDEEDWAQEQTELLQEIG